MTVRDWLPLLIIPISLVVIGFLFTMQQDARQQRIEDHRAQAERELAAQRAQDLALQAYLDQMSTLLIEKDLRSSAQDSEVRTLARARTLTVLRRLDPSRKADVMNFLMEAGLIQTVEAGAWPIIRLGNADLSGASLSGVDLSNANLSGANLSDLTDLSSVDLSGADLRDASLSYANLTDAKVSKEQLDQVDSLEGATMPDGSKHP